VPLAGNDAVSGDNAIDVRVGDGGGAGVAGLLLPPHDARTHTDSSPKQLRTTFLINDISILPERPSTAPDDKRFRANQIRVGAFLRRIIAY
jgi:hypothetical protein